MKVIYVKMSAQSSRPAHSFSSTLTVNSVI
jgi:hypothetical protein